MASIWTAIKKSIERQAPPGSPNRWILQIVALILLVEGAGVLVLSSHFGPWLGILSIVVGFFMLVLVPPTFLRRAEGGESRAIGISAQESVGVRLVDAIVRRIGGKYTLVAAGATTVVAIVAYNSFVSSSPEYGDSDTLTLLLGAFLILYPFVPDKFRVEATFALMFVSLLVVILVLPQAIQTQGTGSRVVNWYVYYMLAAPMSGILNLIGVPASSSGEFVTITFQDGSVNTLGISTGCAGLYSFSIFVSAFISFVLVFERLPRKLMAIVLGVGLLVAYLGNLIRMVIIGVVGYFYGMDSLLWAHNNVGFIIFLGWSSVFWYLVMRYADRKAMDASRKAEA